MREPWSASEIACWQQKHFPPCSPSSRRMQRCRLSLGFDMHASLYR